MISKWTTGCPMSAPFRAGPAGVYLGMYAETWPRPGTHRPHPRGGDARFYGCSWVIPALLVGNEVLIGGPADAQASLPRKARSGLHKQAREAADAADTGAS